MNASELTQTRQERLSRIRSAMVEQSVDYFLLSLGAELPWAIGYEAMPLERPTVLVIGKNDDPILVVPSLEAGRVHHDKSLFSMVPWDDSQDAIALISSLVTDGSTIALSDRAHARLLIELSRSLSKVQWRPSSSVLGPIRAIKDETEIAALVAAGEAADKVARALLAGEIPLVGRSEKAVSDEISQRLLNAGHDKVNLAIVGSGPNAASPHHEPSARIIGTTETVVCDFGGSLHLGEDIGYCSDITRTVVTGKPSVEIRETYAVLQHAQDEAVKAVKPGVPAESIDAVGREIIAAAGLGDFFMHRIGHGIGAEAHEDPYIVKGNETILVPGHAFSIEPGIYKTGRFGARIEDIVAVSDEGVLRLNSTDHSLHIVEA